MKLIEFAVKVLRGYCNKHLDCECHCQFRADDGCCTLSDKSPCDWELKSEVER